MSRRTLVPRVVLLALLAVLSAGAVFPARSMQGAMTRPALGGSLEGMRDAGDLPGMRAHGWALWSRLTAGETAAGGLPLWRTWEPRASVLGPTHTTFGSDAQAPSTGAATGANPPSLHRSSRTVPAATSIRRPSPAVTVYFNAAAAGHIRASRYNEKKTFAAMKSSLDASVAASEAREIIGFPKDAIAVKAIWRVLPPHPAPGETWVLPVWDPNDRNPALSYPATKWGRSVILDLSDRDVPDGETSDMNLPGQAAHPRVISVRCFHRMTLTAEQALAMDAAPGDLALLVGLHVATKELPQWTWTTFWWHDQASEGEFAAGKPASLNGTVWSNYLMNVDFGDPDGAISQADRRPVFNPWLEGPLRRGIASNCVSCHQQASFTSDMNSAPFSPVRLRTLSDADALYKDRLRTDYVWSLTEMGTSR